MQKLIMKGVGHDDENDFETKKLSGNCVRFLLTDFLKNFPPESVGFSGDFVFCDVCQRKKLSAFIPLNESGIERHTPELKVPLRVVTVTAQKTEEI